MNTRRSQVVVLAIVVLAAAGCHTTVRVSTGTGGTEGTGGSPSAGGTWPNLTPDARHVAFESEFDNLVAGDTNGAADIFVKDRDTNTTARVSTGIGGAEANGDSSHPAISADGRYVTFASEATNLVAGDTNGIADIFRVDTTTGTTVLVSATTTGGFPTPVGSAPGSDYPDISADGTAVAFVSTALADELFADADDSNPGNDVFVRDLTTNTTHLISGEDDDGVWTGQGGSRPAIADGGRHVVFQASASLVPADTHSGNDIYQRDWIAGITTLVSVTDAGTAATDGASREPSIDADGTRVAFESTSTGLVAGDTNGIKDVFVRDLTAGTTTRVSVTSTGEQGDPGGSSTGSNEPVISPDGNLIVFSSTSPNLVAGDTNNSRDLFAHNYTSATTVAVSVDADHNLTGGVQLSAPSDGAISTANKAATWVTQQPVDPDDTNGQLDIYLRTGL
ncbi:MAG: calcium-binding protein [bacterium]|nr:calcium-binding protein [bacterium]